MPVEGASVSMASGIRAAVVVMLRVILRERVGVDKSKGN